MSNRVTELSPAQLDRIPHYIEKWTQSSLAIEPADRDQAEQALAWLYTEKAGPWCSEPPKYIGWHDSPLKLARVKTTTFDVMRFRPRSDVDLALKGQVAPDVLRTLDQLLTLPFRIRTNRVQAAIWTRMQILAGEDPYEDPFLSDLTASVGGQYEGYWLARYDFLANECDLANEITPLRGHMMLAQSCGGWWPRIGYCSFCERPTMLHQDEQWCLHCEDGPALMYPDGFAIHAWHGVLVPRDVIEQPDCLCIDRIEREPDPHVRRIMIERYGRERYLIDTGGSVEDALPLGDVE